MRAKLLLPCLLASLPFSSAAGETAKNEEALKAQSNQVWDLGASQGSVVEAGAAAKNISKSPDGKPWNEPFKPSHKSGHYVLGDPCDDINRNGRCDQLFFAGYQRFESPKQNWWRWFFRGLRRDPELYNTPDGVHDDLYARATILKVNGKKVAILEVDAVGLSMEDAKRIRERVQDLGFLQVIVAATHNHEGPDTLGLWGPLSTPALFNPMAWVRILTGQGNKLLKLVDGKNPKFMNNLYDQAAAALREADATAKPAKILLASAPLPDVDGKPIMTKHRDPAVVDDFAHILQARDLEDNPIATLAQVGVHPELFGNKITTISADISGSISKHLEALFGGVGMHVNGAIESVAPSALEDRAPDRARELAMRETAIDKIGAAVGRTAAQALAASLPAPIADLEVSSRAVYIPMDNALFRLASDKKVIDRPLFTDGVETADGQDLQTEMDVIFLKGPKGEPLAEIFSIPGELAPEIYMGGFLPIDKQSNPQAPVTPVLKNYLRAPHQFLIGLGNDELGYIVPLNDFRFPKLWLSLLAQTDKFGRRHYEETVSAGSQMSQIVSLNLIGMLEEHYDGHTEWTPAAIAHKARQDALETFARQREAMPALAQLYAHEPSDDVTEGARAALLEMGRDLGNNSKIVSYLRQAKGSTRGLQKKADISKLISELQDVADRRERDRH